MAMAERINNETEMELSDVRILFFNEKIEYLRNFNEIFRMCGLRPVYPAATIPEAINYLVSQNIDVVIITLFSKFSHSDLLIEELKSLDGTADLPVIAITVTKSVKTILSLYSKGVDAVMTTPLNFKMVETTIFDVLSHKFNQDRLKVELATAQQNLETGNIESAHDGFSRVISEDAYLFEAHLGMYHVYSEKQTWPQATAHLKKAAEVAKNRNDETLLGKSQLYRDLAVTYYNFADYHQKQGATEKAFKNCQIALKLNPFHTDSVVAMLSFMNDPEQIDEITKMIEDNVKTFVPYSTPLEKICLELEKLAQRFTELNLSDHVLTIHRLLVKIPHGNVEVCIKNADYLLERGEISLVIKRLLNFAKKISDTDIMVRAGKIFLDVEAAYLKKNTNHQMEYCDLSFFRELKREEIIAMAEKLFKQALLIDPNNYSYWINILDCYLRSDDTEKINELVKKLLGAEQDNEALYADIISIMLDNRSYDLVAGHLRDALKRFPNNNTFYEYQALFYKEQNKPFEAISFLKKAYNIQPEGAELLLLLGETYLEIKDFSNSIVFYEKAANLLGDDPRVEEGMQKALAAKQAHGGQSESK